MKKFSLLKLILFIAGVELVGFASAMLSGNIKAEYGALSLPPLSPPDWIFGIVWPVLYLLIAIAAYLVYQTESDLKRPAMVRFICNLILNFLWTPVFFGVGMYASALVVILLMIIVTSTVIDAFRRINTAAAWLMVPYLLWLIYAAYLNLGVVILN